MALIYKLRVCLISTVAVLLIIMAVVFTAVRALLPYATEYVAEIQQVLTEQIGLPVSIDAIDADMSWFTPRLKLINLVVKDEAGVNELLRLDEAIFSLAYIDSLFNLSPVVGEINLVGADLYIERHPDDRWIIQGVEFINDGTAEPSPELDKLIKNTNFSLLDSDIHYKDVVRKKEVMDFVGVNATLESFLGTHSLSVDVQLPSGFGDSLLFIASVGDDFENYKTAEWEVYLKGETINVKHWMKELGVKGIPLIEGALDGEVWLSLDDSHISRVSSDISVNNLKLTNEVHTERKWDADYIALKLDWQQLHERWRMDVKDLVLVKNKDAWAETTNIIAIHSDITGFRATASYARPFDLTGLPKVFLVSEDLTEMEKMQSILLNGEFYNISIYFPTDENELPEADATFSNVDLKLLDTGIEFYGIDGVVNYEKGRFDLDLLSESVIVDFGDMFREPIPVDFLTGEIIARHEDYNWIIESSDIHMINRDIEARSRVKVVLDKDGEIVVDLQTDFANGKGESVHKYYPLPAMSSELLDWLDSAIIDGDVEKGSFILFGDVAAFPYSSNDGVFEVVFGGQGLTLHFLDGWPDIQNLYGDVRFYNSSLTIENGTGGTYAGTIKNASAYIPDLDAPVLFVNGDIVAPADDMQKYVWNSGLDDILGDAMRQFQVRGDLSLSLSLEIPLDDDEVEVKVNSELTLSDNEMYFPAMEYLLSGINGKLSFTEDKIEGSDITASFEGAPVIINAYNRQEKDQSENIFHLTGNLPIDGLVKRLDWVPTHWLTGSSDWDITLHIPDEVREHTIKVEMQSALKGVEIDISDALSKSRDDVLHVEVAVAVLHEGIQVDVDSDQTVNFFATRDDDANWDFIVDSALIRGSGEFAEDLNKDSIAKLRLEHVSLNKLAYSSDTSRSVSLDPTIFPSLDIFAKNLVWDNWAFKNASLETNWNIHGMLINKVSIEGPSVKVSGRGSWLNKWNETDETNLEFTLESSDFGSMLSSFGVGDSVNGGKYVANAHWQWPAEPYNFSLGTVKGTSDFELKDGEITDLKPGTGGRVLGLLNAFKLADRLALDFDDVYKDGFKFDSIIGDYRYDAGQAYVDEGIEVKAAAADMHVAGRIGIIDRDYDMVMQVKPHTSGAVFTGFALLGGLVTGAAAVLANKLFGIEKLAHDTYTVTGSWDDPVVVQIAKGGKNSESDNKPQDDE